MECPRPQLLTRDPDQCRHSESTLQFLDRTHYPDSTLDVLFTGGNYWKSFFGGPENGPHECAKYYEKLCNVANHLVSVEGYTPYVTPSTKAINRARYTSLKPTTRGPIDWARTTGEQLMIGYFDRQRTGSPDARREVAVGYPVGYDVFEFRRGDGGERVQLVMEERSA